MGGPAARGGGRGGRSFDRRLTVPRALPIAPPDARPRRAAEKIEQAEGKLAHSGRGLGMGGFFLPGDAPPKGGGDAGKGEDTPLSKVARESMLLAAENIKSQAGQVAKDLLFNFRQLHMHGGDGEPMEM